MTVEERLKQFIEETKYIYDLNDTLEWMLYHKEELLQILLDDKEIK